jgi:hypothetical protein
VLNATILNPCAHQYKFKKYDRRVNKISKNNQVHAQNGLLRFEFFIGRIKNINMYKNSCRQPFKSL